VPGLRMYFKGGIQQSDGLEVAQNLGDIRFEIQLLKLFLNLRQIIPFRKMLKSVVN
jgi:hypothetical protein